MVSPQFQATNLSGIVGPITDFGRLWTANSVPKRTQTGTQVETLEHTRIYCMVRQTGVHARTQTAVSGCMVTQSAAGEHSFAPLSEREFDHLTEL